MHLTLSQATLGPQEGALPLLEHPLWMLFTTLELGNVLTVFTCLMMERKVVLCSRLRSLLTPVAEALLALLYPFKWQGARRPTVHAP